MDWNWFFSALAQSTAAIVGIFSAFIITKIINNQSQFMNYKGKVKQLESISKKLIDDIEIRKFDDLNKFKLHCVEKEVKRILHKEDVAKEPVYYYEKTNIPQYEKKIKVLENIKVWINWYNQRKEKGYRTSVLGNSYPTDEIKYRFEAEEEKINKIISETNEHIRDILETTNHLENNPESSNIITISIVSVLLLFFIGVIYPLSFLPLENPSSLDISIKHVLPTVFSFRGLLLLGISLIFCGIKTVFLITNLSLKYSSEDVKRLTKFSKLSNYSPYFKIAEQNMR